MRFDPRFLKQHAKRLVTDPEIAIVELISNSSDAGAELVEICWPSDQGGKISIKDNGTGMTHDEFVRIWETIAYNRRSEGKEILFPPGNTENKGRKLYGRNGKGRFSLFCFDDEYEVDTVKDSERSVFSVTRNSSGTISPFTVETRRQDRVDDISAHRTLISLHAYYNFISEERLIDLIGTTFIADASLRIHVNGRPIEMTDIVDMECYEVETPFGSISVYKLDRTKSGRTGQQHGVAWHVNGKAVGRIAWRDPNRVVTIEVDGRTAEAKRYSFIVLADILEAFVTDDWSGFEICDETETVLQQGGEFIQKLVNDLFKERRRTQKRVAMDKNRERLKILPKSSRKRVGILVDGLQVEVPALKQDVLNATVRVYAGMEQANTGYDLLDRLAAISPNDIDTLNEILSKWSVRDARVVLDELGARLSLIKQLEKVVSKKSDELHEIHPLFERGLWIMGPSFERADYISNSWLLTVLRKFFKDQTTKVDREQRRPDLVLLPESRLRLFSCDKENSDTGMQEIEKVVVLELKSGKIKLDDIRQAEDYAYELSISQRVTARTVFQCFVIGSDKDRKATAKKSDDNISVNPIKFGEVIHNASKRTYHLMERIRVLGYPYYDIET